MKEQELEQRIQRLERDLVLLKQMIETIKQRFAKPLLREPPSEDIRTTDEEVPVKLTEKDAFMLVMKNLKEMAQGDPNSGWTKLAQAYLPDSLKG